MSLTTKDKRDISEIIDNALTKFAKDLIEPSFKLAYERFTQIEEKLKEHDERFDSLDRKLDLVAEKTTDQERKIADHEERVTSLEATTEVS